jgi:hypothetical protein
VHPVLEYLGFAASRNKKSEEERSPEGGEEAEKRLSHPKKPLQKKSKERRTSAHLEEQSEWQEQQA